VLWFVDSFYMMPCCIASPELGTCGHQDTTYLSATRQSGMFALMTTYTEIIDRWPSLTTYAADIGVRYGTAQVMRYRGSIPARYWKRVVAAAARRGIEGVSLDLLASIEAEPRPRRPDSNQGARSAA
jgi:hypothetical protein